MTVEDATSDTPASKTTREVSVISDPTDTSTNASHAFPSSLHASFVDSGAKVEGLDVAASKISIDTTSRVHGEGN